MVLRRLAGRFDAAAVQRERLDRLDRGDEAVGGVAKAQGDGRGGGGGRIVGVV